jgi:outer membrane receptor for ferrienterochelin and colicins
MFKGKFIGFIIYLIFFSSLAFSQNYSVSGRVVDAQNEPLPFALVIVKNAQSSTLTDSLGYFKIDNLKSGNYQIMASLLGYQTQEKLISISTVSQDLTFKLTKNMATHLNDIVVTGTRTPKRKTNSAVIVNVIDSKLLEQLVATSLSDGLKFQPGLRVETDCQTCNYTQLRMNGLQGGYSQILVNSRPIFSPLTGLYGLEQLPANMIDRIEIVKGGVSALYGSSAIGGTVNVITKVPSANSFDITKTYQSIKGQTTDQVLSGNVSLINDAKNAGLSLFVNHRNRGFYDVNSDNFSELPQLRNNSFGANFFLKPTKNQNLELIVNQIYEYRLGGEMVNKPAYLTQQAEERNHHVFMGSLSYSYNFNRDKNSINVYYGGQNTDRTHYTGISPDDPAELQQFLSNPPYGISDVFTHQGGLQFNNKFNKFLGGKAVLTLGAEYVYDDVFDEIASYQYKIDQTTKNLGFFAQNDWDVNDQINVLAGFRLDHHNLVNQPILSPRLSFLYKFKQNTQFRLGWGTGFRAPQAFDTDLHIAFAVGGVSRISLAQNLREERSNSFTSSINYDKASPYLIYGFTLESFFTRLNDVFFQYPLGSDNFGQIFQKRNGDAAVVKGFSLEARANFDYTFQFDAGFTVQSSKFNTAVFNIDGLAPERRFLRTPNTYGYATFSYTPTKNWNLSSNIVYTGPMLLTHFAGDNTGQNVDEYFLTKSFTDLGFRIGHTFNFNKVKTGLEVFSGFKNVFDAYQQNFDLGKNRDSNFVYGPSIPRTFVFGVKLKSI